RVGERTRQNTPNGSSHSRCNTGTTNAAVLPLPVGDLANILEPRKMWGITFRCTSVGVCIPSSLSDSTSDSDTPRVSNPCPRIASAAGFANWSNRVAIISYGSIDGLSNYFTPLQY